MYFSPVCMNADNEISALRRALISAEIPRMPYTLELSMYMSCEKQIFTAFHVSYVR